MNAEDSVVAAIDELERDEIDELVDWQMSESPAAATQRDWQMSESPAAATQRGRLRQLDFSGGDLGYVTWGDEYADSPAAHDPNFRFIPERYRVPGYRVEVLEVWGNRTALVRVRNLQFAIVWVGRLALEVVDQRRPWA